MKIAIFEPRSEGHHLVYVRLIAGEAIRRGWATWVVTTRQAAATSAYDAVVEACDGRLSTSFMPSVPDLRSQSSLNLLRFQWSHFRAFQAGYNTLRKEAGVDAIYVVNHDYLDKVMSILGSPFGGTPFAGMLMSPTFHHPHMGVRCNAGRYPKLSEALFYRLLRIPTLRSLLTIDETLIMAAASRPEKEARKVRYVPDPASPPIDTTRTETRERMGIPREAIVILVFGVLSKRKGIKQLLGAVASDRDSRAVTVLLAGCADADTRELLGTEAANMLRDQGRLHEVGGFLSPADEDAVFAAADIAWLGYWRFSGASGVLVKAAASRLPVLACDEGLIEWVTRKYRLGEVISVDSLHDIVCGIRRLAENASLREGYGSRGARLAEFHTPAKFAGAICDALSVSSTTV